MIMKRTVRMIGRKFAARTAAVLSLAVCLSAGTGSVLHAEEASGYYDDAGNWIEDSYSEEAGFDIFTEDETTLDAASDASLTGTYSVADGWSVDQEASTDEKTVYKKDSCMDADNTSTITCSYIDTNYSVLEYEQLRDMLTNNLLYSNVNAQISTSAIYTQEKDYLYIVIVDDSAMEYKDVYHYVVGDYRCFCVEVREYRAEAEQDMADGIKTPHEVGQKTAEEFTWMAGN